MRPTLFRLAGDTEDNDEALGETPDSTLRKAVALSSLPSKDAQTKCFDLSSLPADILQANDSLTQVISLYRQLVTGEELSAEDPTTQQPSRCTWVLSYTAGQKIGN